ncbi:unnamed protein product [marine sediment metagenome]|uniref:Uncharacterized protein n=1 Tax=marine sediment metagenome TaxID=412755 RepID=X0Z0V4_9ZZZZ
MRRNQKGPIRGFQQDFKQITSIQSQNGPTVGFYIADLVQFSAEFFGDIPKYNSGAVAKTKAFIIGIVQAFTASPSMAAR